VWPEVEARIADQRWPPIRSSVDPHHLSKARDQLIDLGEIQPSTTTTRGGRAVTVYHHSDLRRRATKTTAAAARKRLLYTRWFGWSQPSAAYPQGRFGPAGEQALHAALHAAAPEAGYRLIRPEGGEVRHLLGAPVLGGPLDSAAWLQTFIDDRPAATILTVIEVKNVREWIYPSAARLYQLLYKAARLQEAHGDMDLVPVFVCRRRQYLTWTMARDLGFYVIEAHNQFVLSGDIEPRHLEEVRDEMGMHSLVPLDSPTAGVNSLIKALIVLPSLAATIADNWKNRGSKFVDFYKWLRDDSIDLDDRYSGMRQLKEAARDLGCDGAWIPHDPEPSWNE